MAEIEADIGAGDGVDCVSRETTMVLAPLESWDVESWDVAVSIVEGCVGGGGGRLSVEIEDVETAVISVSIAGAAVTGMEDVDEGVWTRWCCS